LASHVVHPGNEHFHVPVTLEEFNHNLDDSKVITTSALLDSGASTTFISKRIVDDMELKTYKFERAIPLLNIDGTPNTVGKISHYTYLDLYIPYAGGHKSRSIFAVTDIDNQDVILGIDWLRRHNPTIDWRNRSITLHCCGFTLNPIRIKKGNPPEQTRQYRIYEEIRRMNHKDTAYRILAGFSKSQELAIKAMDGKTKTFEEMVPKPYHDYRDVFSKEKSNQLPAHKSWDLEIKLKEGKELPKPKKAFPMSPGDKEALKEFIQQELKLGRIRDSESEMAAPVFFIKKKDGSLRFVQDYRALNAVTIKNKYLIPLSSELVDQLREARYFMHLDLRNGYNNIRIKEGHEYKLAFNTPLGQFKPLVMYFGMTNAPGAFQSLMNEIFRDLIMNNRVVVYLDDILIFSKTLEEHRKYNREVLRRLRLHDLYLKPEKCEFEKLQTEFLGLIIPEGKIGMDPIKLAGVADWPTPRKLKEVRGFMGFANFYR